MIPDEPVVLSIMAKNQSNIAKIEVKYDGKNQRQLAMCKDN